VDLAAKPDETAHANAIPNTVRAEARANARAARDGPGRSTMNIQRTRIRADDTDREEIRRSSLLALCHSHRRRHDVDRILA
jgi:hypothetical protein